MQRYVIPTILTALWLFLWAADLGLLVFAKRDYYGLHCHYVIGFSVEKDVHRYATRCRLLSRV